MWLGESLVAINKCISCKIGLDQPLCILVYFLVLLSIYNQYLIFRIRETNQFEVSVNVASGDNVTFNLWYQEVLQRRLGVIEHVINIDPGQIVDDLSVQVNLHETRKITHLIVPEIRMEGNNMTSSE